MKNFDAIIIGTGQAGPPLAARFSHVLLDVRYPKAPCTVIPCAMHSHPTVAEYLPTV